MSIKLQIDSREKKNEHILRYFDRHGIDYEIRKLDIDDYMLDGGAISIDTKRSVDELASNMLNRNDHARFLREAKRAADSGIKLIVLLETSKYKAIPDLREWRSKYSGISGRALMDAIYKTHISYGVEFLFCPKISTGRRIIELLSCTDSKSVL
mgnify:CR=1 FL=1